MIDDNEQHETPDPKGEGVGEESGLVERRDAKLEQMAIRHRWGMTDQARTAVMNRQITIAVDPEKEDRRATAAANCLVKMEAQNQVDDHATIPQRHEHRHVLTIEERRDRIAALAQRFGIGTSVDAVTVIASPVVDSANAGPDSEPAGQHG